jgi:hypothetical protein
MQHRDMPTPLFSTTPRVRCRDVTFCPVPGHGRRWAVAPVASPTAATQEGVTPVGDDADRECFE